jgi:tetratricopeptide (TPR) repeat protein
MGRRQGWLNIACALLIFSCFTAAQVQQTHQTTPKARRAVTKPAAEAPAPAPTQLSPVEAIRSNNIGTALMDRHDFPDALGKFQTACVMNPESETSCLNAGVAMLNMLRYDDAQKLLETYAAHHPENARVWFNLGLLARARGNIGPALDNLRKVAAIDPDDPDAQFLIGFLLAEQGHDDQAVVAFKRCLELDPLHVSAEYALSEALGHLGNAYESQAHLERYHRLTALGLGKPLRFVYGEQGKYSLTEVMTAPLDAATPAVPVKWEDVTAAAGLATRTVVAARRPAPTRLTPTPLPNTGETDTPAASAQSPAEPPSASLASFLGAGV